MPDTPPNAPASPDPGSSAGLIEPADAEPAPSTPEVSRKPGTAGRRGPLSARALGRRIAFAIYYAIAGTICIGGAIQVSRQIFFVPHRPSPYPTCHEGLHALVTAVDRARKAAPGIDGEDAAIERFRGALEPEWGYRDGVLSSCKGSAGDERALDAIERLRYAEEHAVRREAGDLAPLRRRVQAIVESELGPGPSRGPNPQSAGDRP